MEDLCKRFPHLGELIFANLDDQSFTKCKEASKEISQFFDQERFFWIRIIRNYRDSFMTFQESWKEVIAKTPVENVKQLAVAVQKFFTLYSVTCHKQLAPLHIAAEQENLSLCEHIISKVNNKNPQGNLFIHENILESNIIFEVYRGKFKNKRVHAKTTALHIAALKGNVELFKLIANSTQVRNPVGNEGYMPLHIAATHGHQELFHFIVNNGEENPCNKYGRTPLHMAADNGHIEIFQFIVDKVVDKNPAQNYNLWTPLHYACLSGHFEICKLIVGKVQNKNPVSDIGQTPLHLAALKGHLKIFNLISEMVRNNNPPDNHGSTPMHIAAQKGNLEVCKIIIDKNKVKRKNNRRDINPFCRVGWTPLHFAADNGYLEICRLIIDNVENKSPEYMKTSRDLAEGKNYTDIVKLFDKSFSPKTNCQIKRRDSS